MHVLVVNCGSSSIKIDRIDMAQGGRVAQAHIERVGSEGCQVSFDGGDPESLGGVDHAGALALVLPKLSTGDVRAVGHRVVHGGDAFDCPVRIDEAIEAKIEALSSLAPLHNPVNLAGIRAARELLPHVVHVAVFDTAFHATLPRRARAYALPSALVEAHGLRRYGFHGTSHQWVAQQAADALRGDVRNLRIITCHLGNGCSIAAIENGRSVETSMGLTPLEGLVMGTRSGDLDPGVLIRLMREEGLDADGLDSLLNRESGLTGLSGVGNDMRDIETRAADGDEACRLALHVFTHRLRKYIGAYAAIMGGVDVIVFTAGIGENSALIRHRAAQRLEFLGARLDEDRNRDAKVDAASPATEISQSGSRVRLMVVHTDEARAIAVATAKLAEDADAVDQAMSVPVAISARHVHLTQEAVEALFGPGHQLTVRKPLTQPGQFAAEETVTLVGPKRSIERVRILGPTRSRCQVEIARTDEFRLGIDAPVRRSGDLDNTPGIKLVGPAGELLLEEGVICAWRHIHMTPENAVGFGVKHRDLVEVAIDSDGRDLIFGDVMVRVSAKYALEMHIDTDEANAAEIVRGQEGVLVKAGSAHLRKKRT